MSYWVAVYKFMWGALIALLLLGAAFAFIPKWREYSEYQRRRAEAADRIRLEEEMLKVLKNKQDRFMRDPRFVTQIAHDLGLASTNELIIKFQTDEAVVPSRLPPAHAPAATNRTAPRRAAPPAPARRR